MSTSRTQRPMHWSLWPRELQAACGKDTSRTRNVTSLSAWDDSRLAGGRRCPTCAEYVEHIRPRAHGGA